MSRGLSQRKRKLRELLPHKRRFSYQKTFGAGIQYVQDFMLDPLQMRRNQNVPDEYFGNPALFNGCTGFGVTGIAETDLKQRLDPKFTYDHTILISGSGPNDPQTLEDAFRSAGIYGVRLRGENDGQALLHRRSPYFEVHPSGSLDWYDALLFAVYTNQRPVSVGTTWPVFFENIDASGIQTYKPLTWKGGHCWNIIGKKTIDGVEYLIGDTWNGPAWGDHGLCYFSREIINATMKIGGSDALTNRPVAPGDIQRVQLDILQLITQLLKRLLHV